MKKDALQNSSLAAALFGWLLLSVLNVFVFWALRDRARLIRDNENERTLNTLWSELRNYSDFASAVESSPVLKERVIGVAVYDTGLIPVYRWGKVPAVFDEGILDASNRNRFGRYTIPDRKGRSAKFVLYFGRMNQTLPGNPPGLGNPPPAIPSGPPAREHEMEHGRVTDRDRVTVPDRPVVREGPSNEQRRQNEGRQPSPEPQGFFSGGIFRGSRYFYIDIFHPDYWRTRTLTAILFPLLEIVLLILVFYIRRLYLRNREYQEKIEAQHNLVVLGTAAGTLAHEIKNPLLSIRLQTGILQKLKGEEGKDEINIINQEVDRLSSLVYRVNDYLREPGGEKTPLNIACLLDETSKRICGHSISNAASPTPALIFADENRIRSVLENIFRNAVESGSPPEDIDASVGVEGEAHNGKSVVVSVYDRGRGIDEKNLKRVFDPFFTSKSTGTGIGLAISKRFTEAAGGIIGVENRPGGGLMVTLTFPLYNENENR